MREKLPENIGIIGNGVCPLSVLNMYWIHSVALHMLPVVTHISFRALTLLEGAWTSLQALYMAAKQERIPSLTEKGSGIASLDQ